MPTAIANRRAGARSLASIGPALPSDSGAAPLSLRVQSVFRLAINLRVEGSEILASLSGPGAAGLPQALCLAAPEDFRDWGLEPGSSGEWGKGRLWLQSGSAAFDLDCSRALRRPKAGLVRLASLGGAFIACLEELARIQASKATDLRIASLIDRGAVAGGEEGGRGASTLLRGAALLGDWALAAKGAALAPRPEPAVARLVGNGPGLTPAGDDFLSGFLGAAETAGFEGRGLGEAVLASLHRSTELSASLLRLATRGFFPEALASLGVGLSRGDRACAILALRELCSIGHSSGADLATGYIYGLSVLLAGGPSLCLVERRRLHAS